MNDQGAAAILYNLVQAQSGPSATLTEIEAQVQVVAAQVQISEEIVDAVLSRFRAERQTMAAATAPRLLVDWGELPRVGQSVRPEFSLLCPQYASRPELRITVDRDLDHDASDPLRRPQADEPGLWTFHVPFRMTTNGIDCRPGHYLIDVEVFFRDAPAELPRFYRCCIRMNVPDAQSGKQGVLEIDGDGQSIVNLQGYNLKQFAKVVLKGGKDSIINLQNVSAGNETSSALLNQHLKPATSFEYQLKVHAERQSRLPRVFHLSQPRAYLDAAGFFFEDGRRVLVMTSPRITFGRSRENDVVLRFLPRNQKNDEHSRNVSRTHLLVELTSEGVEIRDESHREIEVNNSVVRDRIVVPAAHAGDAMNIDLGVAGTIPKAFRMEMLMFAPDRNPERAELEFWDELYCDLVGGRLSRLARQSLDLQLDAIRFERAENLAGEEAYVLLLREALIGGAPHRAAIVLNDTSLQAQARLLHLDRSFWLEPLPGSKPVRLNETPLPPRTLAPLAPGVRIQFGDEIATFDRPCQLYLD